MYGLVSEKKAGLSEENIPNKRSPSDSLKLLEHKFNSFLPIRKIVRQDRKKVGLGFFHKFEIYRRSD